jgi:2-methylisocitrate lyase-like PEP mutase family enzyme
MLLASQDYSSASTPARRLRNLLATDGLIRAPGIVDALAAKLVERAQFEAVHLTGSGVARSMGFPDVGLVTMTETLERARSVARAVRLPVIADADTGYGNAINVIRTVQEFEAAGVAAVHIEDQVTPKRCGHYEGKQLIPVAEMVSKIKAACAARRDPDFVIIARTDARSVEGFEDAIRGAHAYHQAGADVLFIEAPETIGEIGELVVTLQAPLLINMYSGGKTPIVSMNELRRLGYRIAIVPSHLQRAAIRGMQRALELLQRGDVSAAEDSDLMVSFHEREEIVGFAEIESLEERYLALAAPPHV